MRTILLMVSAMFGTLNTTAQPGKTKPAVKERVYGAMAHYGTVLVHTKQVANTRGAKPVGAQLELATMHTDIATFKKWGFYNRAGWSFDYFNFNTPVLGSSFSTGYFIEPIFKVNNRTELRAKATLGMGYLTNPNRDNKDSSALANHNYGSHLNSFLRLSFGVTMHLGQHVSGYVCGNFNHNSNAGFAIPNRGVNYPSVSVGVLYHTAGNNLPAYKKTKNNNQWKKENGIKYSLGLFASPKDGWAGEGLKYSKRLLIGGMVMAGKQVSKVNALTLGIEAYNDGGMHLTKQNIGDNSTSFFAGLLVGNELLLERFVLSQQLGFHIYRNTNNYNEVYLKQINPIHTFYQRYGISYQMSNKWKAGFSFLARGDFADFIDLRVLYRLK